MFWFSPRRILQHSLITAVVNNAVIISRDAIVIVFQYAIFLLVIIILQVVLAVLMFTYNDTFKESLVGSVNGVFDKMSVDSSYKVVFSNIEMQVSDIGFLFIPIAHSKVQIPIGPVITTLMLL